MATCWENSCSFGLRYVSWYKYLIVSLVFSHLGFWSGNLFLIAPFPDLCLLVPFLHANVQWVYIMYTQYQKVTTKTVVGVDRPVNALSLLYKKPYRTIKGNNSKTIGP